MRWIEQPPFGAPGCAVIPHRETDPKGFIDTDRNLLGVDPHIFVSAAAVVEMARLIDFPSPEEHSRVLAELEGARVRVRQLEDEVQELNRLHDGYDAFCKAGFVPRKAPGRPKAQKAA